MGNLTAALEKLSATITQNLFKVGAFLGQSAQKLLPTPQALQPQPAGTKPAKTKKSKPGPNPFTKAANFLGELSEDKKLKSVAPNFAASIGKAGTGFKRFGGGISKISKAVKAPTASKALAGLASGALDLAGGFGKVVASLVELPGIALNWSRELIDSQRHLGEFNGTIAAILAKADIEKVGHDVRVGDQTASSLNALVDSQTKLSRSLEQQESFFTNFQNLIGTLLNKLLTSISQLFEPIFLKLNEAIQKYLGDDDTPVNSADWDFIRDSAGLERNPRAAPTPPGFGERWRGAAERFGDAAADLFTDPVGSGRRVFRGLLARL